MKTSIYSNVDTEEGIWKVVGCSARKAIGIHLGHGDKQDQREPKLAPGLQENSCCPGWRSPL